MTTQAQTLANIAASDFAGAVQTAFATGFQRSTGFGSMEYEFDDGSVLTLRGGRVQSPAAQRTIYRDACGDIDVRITLDHV